MSDGEQRGPLAAAGDAEGVGLGLRGRIGPGAALRRSALLDGVAAAVGVAVFFGAGLGQVLP